jgi:XTP/dITP diphosphohydrolase
MPLTLLLATGNQHKVGEMRGLLQDLPVEIVSLAEFPELEMPEETGDTMRENARIKAVHCARETGLASIADDSGIEVDALNGAPGVRSARWIEGSDAARTNGLLQAIKGVPQVERTARYRCAICLAWPLGELLSYQQELSLEEVEATCEGQVGFEWRGTHGFGYDPVFVITAATGLPDEWVGHTMAEIPPALKAQISHRARAIALMRPTLAALAR